MRLDLGEVSGQPADFDTRRALGHASQVQGSCLPFIGAGLSLNAKLPPWQEDAGLGGLGRKAADALPEYQYTTALAALSGYAHAYSRVKLVEFLSDAPLVTTIRPAKPHEEFCRLPFERVVTTNFDFLLEQAYAQIPAIAFLRFPKSN